MRQVAPHLQRVLQIHSRNETLHSLFQFGKVALDRLDTGVVALDETGRIVIMNEQAESVLQTGQGVTVRRGRVTAKCSSETRNLETLINSAIMTARGRGTGNGGAIRIPGDGGSPATSIVVTPFPSSYVFAKGQPRALAFVYHPRTKPQSRAAALRSLFGLSPAECRLAGLLHEGMELRMAAEKMGVTVGTVRFMLKSIFGKTASHRQSELIQLLSRLPGEKV